MRTCFGLVVIAQATFVSRSVVLVAKILFFLEEPRGCLSSEYNTQVCKARTLEILLLQYKWCIIRHPLT